MRRRVFLLTALLLCLMTAVACAATPINKDGYYKGIRLAGKVKVVEYGADIKVQVVEHWPDLRVKVVSSFPDDIGEWEFVVLVQVRGAGLAVAVWKMRVTGVVMPSGVRSSAILAEISSSLKGA